MIDIELLIDGHKRFRKKHFDKDKKLYQELATEGQTPKTLIIACSDSRVDPAIIFDADPGDLFVIRNVANLVPPYQPMNESYHGTSAALEFGVNNLKVEHIIVLGHSGCAGIKSLCDHDDEGSKKFSFISSWVNIAKEAKEMAQKGKPSSVEEMYSLCEKESILTSIENLLTFPWIKEKVKNNTLALHGWYFSLNNGKLLRVKY
ncbi:MAG: carbonic anhydrase [Rickettsiales bacterium]|nr:MAG: carbonic anhydrase [Rickettsiales bacterium]